MSYDLAVWHPNGLLSDQAFRVLNTNFECSADSQSAFYQDQLTPNFDPNLIPAGSQVTNCDVNGIYLFP